MSLLQLKLQGEKQRVVLTDDTEERIHPYGCQREVKLCWFAITISKSSHQKEAEAKLGRKIGFNL